MTWLISSDLHLTDRPKDNARWGLFPWLASQQAKHNVTATYLLGDLTENKDKHSATLVNRLVDELIGLRPPIYILRGNHDGLDPANPYFRFLSTIEGVFFIVRPTYIEDVTFLPHCRTQAEFDASCKNMLAPYTKMVLCHNTFEGAIAETNARLTGLGASLVSQMAPQATLYAGDIHRPQQCGPVTYIGAPYQVRFGDDYTPRVLLIKNGKEQNLYFPSPRKWTLTVQDQGDILNNGDLRHGDQAKITIEMTREEVVEWPAHRARVIAACKEVGLEVYGCELKVNTSQRPERIALKAAQTPKEVLAAFCQAENVASNIKQVGREMLNAKDLHHY